MKTFTIANLPELDNGRSARAIDQAIKACCIDVADRPAERKARKVNIVIEFKPETTNEDGVLEGTSVRINVKTAIPERHTPEYTMLQVGEGVIGFQPLSPENPRQGGFDNSTVDKTTGEVKPG